MIEDEMIKTEETEQEAEALVVEVDEADAIEIEVDEVFVSLDGGGQQFNHALLDHREDKNQHPIIAIEGLREELDKIESLQTIYSDKRQQADYYMWHNDVPDNPYGLFVSIFSKTDHIQICDGNSDVFGVTVDSAAFIGNQEYAEAEGGTKTGRDGYYCPVVCYGAASVRRESTVVVGDYVVPNSRGEAKKSDGNYGYLVTALSEKYGELYAVISLKEPSTLSKNIADGVEDLTARMNNAEYNITSAINAANSAYVMAKDAEVNSDDIEEKITEVLGRMDTIDGENGVIDNLNQSINNACTNAALATTIANNAVSTATQIGDDAYAHANEAIAAIKDIGAGSTSWAKRIAAYSVGEYSQAYGLTWEQAKSALEKGIVYIPTMIRTETYAGETAHKQEFVVGYFYTWSGEGWTPSLSTAVNFSSIYIAGSSQTPYWVVTDADAEYNGATYALGHLYKWNNGAWEYTGANVTENTLTRAVSAIQQAANELSMEVTNARGDAASLGVRINENESSVQTLARWTGSDEGKYNIATTKVGADDDGASIALVVVKDGTDEELGGARIVLNDGIQGSSIQLDADRINFLSKSLKVYPSDGHGNLVDEEPNFAVDSEGNVGIKGHIEANSGTIGNVAIEEDGSIVSKNGNFSVDADGNLIAKGSGKIGGWDITDTSLISGGVGISSDTSDDAVAFWAGKSDESEAPFKVTNQGYVYSTYGKIGGWDIEANKLSTSYQDIESTKYDNILLSGSTEMNASGFASVTQTANRSDPTNVNDKIKYISGINTNPENTYESLAPGSNISPITFYCGVQQLYDGSEMRYPFIVLADGSLYANRASFGEEVKLGGQTIKSILTNIQNLSNRMNAYEDGKVAGISIEECILYTGESGDIICDILNDYYGTISGTNYGGITITYPALPFSVVCPYAVNVTYFRGTTVVYRGEGITLYPYDVINGSSEEAPADMYYEIKFDVLNGSRPTIYYGEDENGFNTISSGGWPNYPLYTLKCGRGAFDTKYGSPSITDDQWQIIVVDGDENNPSYTYKVLDYAPVITLTVPEN